MAYYEIGTGMDWRGVDWMCKTWCGFVKGGFVKKWYLKIDAGDENSTIFFRADQIANRAIKDKDCGTQGTISGTNITVLKEIRMLSYNIISEKFVQAANKIDC